MKRILICESGATKGDWRVIEAGIQTARVMSAGTNVSTMDVEVIRSIIQAAARQLPAARYDNIHFYTAGVVTSSIETDLAGILHDCFDASDVEVQNDLIASARAACGHEPGIAVIMGTGANSCQWDGSKIVKRVNAGGFIIGDDGSASVLGKLFISDYIKGLVPDEIAEDYARKYPSEYADIVDMVYRNPGSPSAWLGSLCPFIISYYDHPYIKRLVDGNFKAMVDRCLKFYDIGKYPVGIVGGFGNALKDIITPIFEENGVRIRAFISSPIEQLIEYHTSLN